MPESTLALNGVPYDAEIRLDERFAPQESFSDGLHRLGGLAPGWHTVEIAAPGQRVWSQPILLLEGENWLTPDLAAE